MGIDSTILSGDMKIFSIKKQDELASLMKGIGKQITGKSGGNIDLIQPADHSSLTSLLISESDNPVTALMSLME